MSCHSQLIAVCIRPATLNAFMQYHWPGNVRELENMVRRKVVLGNEQAVMEEIALRGSTAEREEEPSDMLYLEALVADFSDAEGIDL